MLLILIASFAEVLSLGSVLPFLGVLASPEKVAAHPVGRISMRVLHLQAPHELVLPMALAFGAAALFNGGARLALLWVSTRLAVLIGADLAIDIYRRTLYQPYVRHLMQNSSEVIDVIAGKSAAAIQAILMVLNLVSATLILIAILAVLLAVDTPVALAALSGCGLIYAVVIGLTRRPLLENGERVAQNTREVIKSLQEGLGGIRDVLLNGSQAFYCELMRHADLHARRAQGNCAFLAGSPRFAVEALAMLLIAGLAYAMASRPGGVMHAIPVLGALALGAQRLLPLMQQAYASWAGIKAQQASVAQVLQLLDQPLPQWAGSTPPPLPFVRHIQLEGVSFRYGTDGPWALEDVDLLVARGARIGIVGASGSGKSTLLDILMGLLTPTRGCLRIDGRIVGEAERRAWQAHLAHVPQSVFLADASIEENIAFGVPREQIDPHRVRQAARRAQLAETIEAWPEGYATRVGERGLRLSGGQRQRIGIARALYKPADVIVFDEATSALDGDTESAVMAAIEALDSGLTIIIIAHRLSTLAGCQQILELRRGRLAWRGSYAEIATR